MDELTICKYFPYAVFYCPSQLSTKALGLAYV